MIYILIIVILISCGVLYSMLVVGARADERTPKPKDEK